MIAETAAWAADQGKTLFDILPDIYQQFGFYKEHLISVVRKGKAGAEEIQKMMDNYRENPPVTINRSKVIKIMDYQQQKQKDLHTDITSEIELPKSNVLQFFLEDGTKISVRPSGTEPKIKFYFSVNEAMPEKSEMIKISSLLDERIRKVIADMGLI
jgi:phosphoglucomutase